MLVQIISSLGQKLGTVATGSKVITTMVIRPLDDRTHSVRYALIYLGLWRKLYDCSMHKFRDITCRVKRVLLSVSSVANRLAVN